MILQPATITNKLTGLTYDGVRAIDWKQAKMIGKVPQSPTRQVASGTGRGRRIIGEWAGHTIHLETEKVSRIKIK